MTAAPSGVHDRPGVRRRSPPEPWYTAAWSALSQMAYDTAESAIASTRLQGLSARGHRPPCLAAPTRKGDASFIWTSPMTRLACTRWMVGSRAPNLAANLNRAAKTQTETRTTTHVGSLGRGIRVTRRETVRPKRPNSLSSRSAHGRCGRLNTSTITATSVMTTTPP